MTKFPIPSTPLTSPYTLVIQSFVLDFSISSPDDKKIEHGPKVVNQATKKGERNEKKKKTTKKKTAKRNDMTITKEEATSHGDDRDDEQTITVVRRTKRSRLAVFSLGGGVKGKNGAGRGC